MSHMSYFDYDVARLILTRRHYLCWQSSRSHLQVWSLVVSTAYLLSALCWSIARPASSTSPMVLWPPSVPVSCTSYSRGRNSTSGWRSLSRYSLRCCLGWFWSAALPGLCWRRPFSPGPLPHLPCFHQGHCHTCPGARLANDR